MPTVAQLAPTVMRLLLFQQHAVALVRRLVAWQLLDVLLVNLGLQAHATDALSMGLTASGDIRGNAQSGGLALNLRYSW